MGKKCDKNLSPRVVPLVFSVTIVQCSLPYSGECERSEDACREPREAGPHPGRGLDQSVPHQAVPGVAAVVA